jgi:guanosine-3',5'-bis(diphosphate) 3'-pyrophosphohydrolase
LKAENHPDVNGRGHIIDRAYIFSARVHDGQMRLSGEPYLSHPLEVAGILADMKLDSVSIAAGLLHDVIEDTHATEAEIGEMFGHDVRHIVSGVTKLSKLPFNSAQAREAESIRKMLLAMADDIRVILIKLADPSPQHADPSVSPKRGQKEKDRQGNPGHLCPHRFAIGHLLDQERIGKPSFQFMNPEAYEDIRRRVDKDKEDRENYVETVKRYIQKKLDENELKAEVSGRYKHFYSIHQKMLNQNLPFEEIYDIIAFRIILDTIPQCYEALGLMHSLWRPIAKKFKDYIGMPKPNMYQSLHTTVIGPFGERIEVQIRTHEMDRVAKSGIAAHWSYKEGKVIDENASKTFAWVQNLVENQEAFRDPNEFLENVRIDLFPDEVYVFTPQGQIKSLPKGATPVDFAYLIHTEVGAQCVGAKVNGRMVPLKYELQTGEIVEVITNKGHHPSKDWLNFVKTVKARSRIRQWIKTQEKERSISLGREMCEKAFRKYRLNFNALIKTEKMQTVVENFGFKQTEDLIASVGYGKITPLQIIRKITPKEAADDTDAFFNKIVAKDRRKKDKGGVMVKGVDDILVRFGKCCQPVPGDPITGYITRGYGVTVHRTTCVNAMKLNPERQIEVEWNQEMTESYPVKIVVRSLDRVGLLADVAANISKSGANILSANTETKENQTVDSYFTLSVQGTDHLTRVVESLKHVKQVLEVKRLG